MICPSCHAEIAFDTKRGKQKYCSNACRATAQKLKSLVETPIDRAIKAGIPVPQIAQNFAIHTSSIYARARRLGLSPAPVVHVPEWYDDALKLHSKGQTIKEISDRIHVNTWSVRRLLTIRGLTPHGMRAKSTRVAVARVASTRREVVPRWYGETVAFGPIKEKVYRVLSGAKIEVIRGGGQRVSGGKVELETADSYRAFRFIEGRKGFIKTDETNMVLAYGTGKKVVDV